nr:hypothetical protein [Bacillus pumilus]
MQESFTQNGAGVKVETSAEAIDSMKEGYVVEVKKKSDTGLTVVVQSMRITAIAGTVN